MGQPETRPELHAATLATELRFVLSQFVRRFRTGRTLPGPQLSVLIWISREGRKTTSQLAALEGVRAQSMGLTVNELYEAGLIERHPDPHDGRQVLIEMTPAGQAIMAAYRQAGETWAAQAITDRLDADERATLAAALKLLERLLDD